MKKYFKGIALLVAMLMLVSVFAVGCAQKTEAPQSAPETKKEDVQKEEPKKEEAKKEEVKWPTKPVQVIVPAGAGGDTDFNARTVSKYLEKELGKSFVVVNVKGAGGTVGSKKVKDAEPDGHTVLFYHNGMLINTLLGLVDYGHQDFKEGGVAVLDKACAFVTSANSKYKTLQDVVDQLKAKPKSVTFATEVGSFTHLQVLALQEAAGVEFNIVDVGGAAAKTAALKGGQIDVIGTQYGLVKQYIDSGDFTAIGILADKPVPGVDAKTFKEQGYDVAFDKFYHFAFPKDTPDEIVDKFTKALEKVVNSEEYQKDIAKFFLVPKYMAPADATEYLNKTEAYYQTFKEKILAAQKK
jgi:tripartite-type tricarboxylate transporter receptor subunit TctC